MMEIESTISVLNTIIQNITFRALYQINETVVITLTDGEFIVKSNLLLMYQKEENPILNDRFYILLLIIVLLLFLWIVSIIGKVCKMCCCCCCSSQKGKNVSFHPYDEQPAIELTSIRSKEDDQRSISRPTSNNANINSSKKKRNPHLPPPLPRHPPPSLPVEVSSLPNSDSNERIITKKSRRPSD